MQRSVPACIAVSLILLALVISLAADRVKMARDSAFFAERVRYNRHVAAPDDIDALYDVLGFHPDSIRNGDAVPRNIPARLPNNLDKISDNAARKEAFIAIMLPPILRVNELVREDRLRLLTLMERRDRGGTLSPRERRWLIALAREHGLRPERVADIDFRILKRRVDVIPVSLALAQGAIESGWGTSRFARDGNAIYGQWTWDDSHEGIIPSGRGSEEKHRIRAFAYLIDSVRGYVRNLNRNPAYVRFREQRERAGDGQSDSYALAATLISYSTRREAYIEDVRSIIRFNRLTDFDQARLAPRRRALSKSGPDIAS